MEIQGLSVLFKGFRLKNILTGVALVASLSLQAQDRSDERMFVAEPRGQTSSIESEGIELHVDPAELESLPSQAKALQGMSREQILERIEADLTQNYKSLPSETEIEVPLGPRFDLGRIVEDDSQLPKTSFPPKIWYAKMKSWVTSKRLETTRDELEAMSESELKTFVARKQAMLTDFGRKIQAFAKKWRIPLSIQRTNSFLRGINDGFYSAPKNVAMSNSGVGEISFTIQGGASLGKWISEWLVKKLAHSKFAKYVRTDAGVYFATNIGFAVSRTVMDGKKYYAFEIFHEIETFKSTLYPQFLLNAAVLPGFSLEHRSRDTRVFKFERSYIPMVGVTSKGPDHYSVGSGMPITPLITPAGVEANVTRIYLVRVPLNGNPYLEATMDHQIAEAYAGIFHPALLCRQVFY